MEEWRLLDLEYAKPFMNLAVEEAILRTYRIQPVGGKLTKEEEELAKRLCEEKYCKDE